MLNRAENGSGPAARTILGVLVVFTLMALGGYATFGVHPDLLAAYPGAAGAYGLALRIFPIGQVWLAFAALALYLTLRTGTRWLFAFVLLYGFSLSSELMGTGYGVPFGAYHYSSMLGTEWFGRVPVLIPLSWFSMSVAAYGISPRGSAAGFRGSFARIAFASLLLLCWDLSLDPAMSHATTFWVWGATGPYYGMPWSNLAGWYVTGIVLATALAVSGADGWMRGLSQRWLAGFYAANVLLAFGMNVAAGLWVAAVTTAVALVLTWIVIAATSQRNSARSRAGEAAVARPVRLA